jgi:hypothetical protein
MMLNEPQNIGIIFQNEDHWRLDGCFGNHDLPLGLGHCAQVGVH